MKDLYPMPWFLAITGAVVIPKCWLIAQSGFLTLLVGPWPQYGRQR